MKRIHYLIVHLIIPLCLMSFLFTSTYAGAFKWTRVNKFWMRVLDNGHQTQTFGAKYGAYYFDNFKYEQVVRAVSSRLGVRDWTDEEGNFYPVKLAGAAHDISDEEFNMFPKEDAEYLTIHRYFRYSPPSIIVDGFILNEPFPQEGDEVAPDKILGTADVMIESFIGTWMGVDIHQRVLFWTQKNHDDYVIFDWTFTNTGNVDRDDDIELPNQTLKDLYFMKEGEYFPYTGGKNGKEWINWYGCRPGDSLRITYTYPARGNMDKYDTFGGAQKRSGYLEGPVHAGEAMLHVPISPRDPTDYPDPTNDNPIQPRVHYARGPDILPLSHGSETKGLADWLLVYNIMKDGYNAYMPTPVMTGTYPGTAHDMPPDSRGFKFETSLPIWDYWHLVWGNSSGPWTLEPGESIRIVWASVAGSISPRVAWDKGREWLAGTIEPPPGCIFGETDNLPQPYKDFPSLYAADDVASEYSNWAKDCWIATSKDSLFQNAWNAQWAVRNDYNVPTAPPPPSIIIKSLPNKINITWGDESESALDFAGYRVYRTIPMNDSTFFYLIFACGEGTGNPLTHSYDDLTAQRGIGYTYYVTAFDNGIDNIPDANGNRESLESGQYLNMTTQPAYLSRAAGTLSTVRVVPNPFNITAAELQYIGEPDKIMFLDIPGYCTIKIYSESGDLVKTLYHTSGSGDQSWGVLLEEHMTSDTGQIVVSGIYIALIEENNEDGTPTGEKTFVKFVIVR